MVLKFRAARSTPARRSRSKVRSPRQAMPSSSAVSRAIATLPTPLAAKFSSAAATAGLDTSVASTRLKVSKPHLQARASMHMRAESSEA